MLGKATTPTQLAAVSAVSPAPPSVSPGKPYKPTEITHPQELTHAEPLPTQVLVQEHIGLHQPDVDHVHAGQQCPGTSHPGHQREAFPEQSVPAQADDAVQPMSCEMPPHEESLAVSLSQRDGTSVHGGKVSIVTLSENQQQGSMSANIQQPRGLLSQPEQHVTTPAHHTQEDSAAAQAQPADRLHDCSQTVQGLVASAQLISKEQSKTSPKSQKLDAPEQESQPLQASDSNHCPQTLTAEAADQAMGIDVSGRQADDLGSTLAAVQQPSQASPQSTHKPLPVPTQPGKQLQASRVMQDMPPAPPQAKLAQPDSLLHSPSTSGDNQITMPIHTQESQQALGQPSSSPSIADPATGRSPNSTADLTASSPAQPLNGSNTVSAQQPQTMEDRPMPSTQAAAASMTGTEDAAPVKPLPAARQQIASRSEIHCTPLHA